MIHETMFGIPVVENPYVPDGTVLIIGKRDAIVIGMCPRTELELVGYAARHIVRRGLADVLEWLGEEVGPEMPPTGAAILARLRAGRR